MDSLFIGITEALTYAAVSQQVEVTPAMVLVYYDQLRAYSVDQIRAAVKTWVREYDEPYRRLPTVGELRAIIRRDRSTIDPKVLHEMEAGRIMREAKASGKSQGEIDELLARHDAAFKKMSVRQPSDLRDKTERFRQNERSQ